MQIGVIEESDATYTVSILAEKRLSRMDALAVLNTECWLENREGKTLGWINLRERLFFCPEVRVRVVMQGTEVDTDRDFWRTLFTGFWTELDRSIRAGVGVLAVYENFTRRVEVGVDDACQNGGHILHAYNRALSDVMSAHTSSLKASGSRQAVLAGASSARGAFSSPCALG